jgi:hypothetical protein
MSNIENETERQFQQVLSLTIQTIVKDTNKGDEKRALLHARLLVILALRFVLATQLKKCHDKINSRSYSPRHLRRLRAEMKGCESELASVVEEVKRESEEDVWIILSNAQFELPEWFMDYLKIPIDEWREETVPIGVGDGKGWFMILLDKTSRDAAHLS